MTFEHRGIAGGQAHRAAKETAHHENHRQRRARVHQILEGTNEIMRVIVAREMMKGQV